METWDEVWKSFQNYSPEVANFIFNENNPNKCPSILKTLAPWELVQGIYSTCLCVNYEGTNALRRGKNKACEYIEDILSPPDLDNDKIYDDKEPEKVPVVLVSLQENDKNKLRKILQVLTK